MPPRPPQMHSVGSHDDDDDPAAISLGELVRDAYSVGSATPSGALDRQVESEATDTLRAIGAGEVDAFVISDGQGGQQVFALSTADRPYRMFVDNMRDGAATVSA